jgi:hypothetical protein
VSGQITDGSARIVFFTDPDCPNGELFEMNATGTITPFGPSELALHICDLRRAGGALDSAFTVTGDAGTVSGTVITYGVSAQPPPQVATFHIELAVTSGTGRFGTPSGTIVLDGALNNAPPLVTGTASGSITYTPPRRDGPRRNVEGTMTGPGGFRFLGCDGVVSAIGNGTYAATGLGAGVYEFTICIDTSTFPIGFTGDITFTSKHGRATLTGAIDGAAVGPGGPTFPVTITGGTRRFAHTRGELMLGPFVQTDQHNCMPSLICFDWTDTARITGALRHVGPHWRWRN